MNPPDTAGPFVFVSYAHDDLLTIRSDIEHLAEQGHHIWYDTELAPGQPWAEQLATTIDAAALFLIFLTPRSVASQNCLNEVHLALQRGKRILAVYIEDVSLPPELELGLGRHQGVRRFAMSSADYLDRLPLLVSRFLKEDAARRPEPESVSAPTTIEATPPGLTADDLCSLGRARLALPTPQKIAEARAFYEAALTQSPDHAAAHGGFALSLCAVRYPFLFSWNPRTTRSLLYTWSGYDQQRVPAIARSHAARALELDPDNCDGHIAMATILLGQHSNDEALPHIAAARRLDPTDAGAMTLDAVALAGQDQGEAALTLMQQAVNLHPRSALLELNCALLNDRLGRSDAVIEHGRRALALAPQWSGALMLRSEREARAGRWVEAWTWLKEAAASEPTHFAHQGSMIALLALLGGCEPGMRILAEIDERAAPVGMIDTLRLNLLAADGRLEEVAELSEAWLQREPLTPVPLVFAAHAHLACGRPDACIAHLEDHLAPHRGADGSLDFSVTNALAMLLYRVAQASAAPGPDTHAELQRMLPALDYMEARGNVAPEIPYGRACITGVLGDLPATVAHLREALARGYMRLWELEQFPCYADLRAFAPYRELIADWNGRHSDAVAAIAAIEA